MSGAVTGQLDRVVSLDTDGGDPIVSLLNEDRRPARWCRYRGGDQEPHAIVFPTIESCESTVDLSERQRGVRFLWRVGGPDRPVRASARARPQRTKSPTEPSTTPVCRRVFLPLVSVTTRSSWSCCGARYEKRGTAVIFNFVYLDKPTLAGYAAQVDGGLIAETKTRNAKAKSGEAGFGFKWLSAKLGTKSDDERSQTLSDAPEAQFQRLIAAGNVDPDAIAWNDILEPRTHFDSIQVGELIKWECDLDIPVANRLLEKGGSGTQLLTMVETMIDTLTTGGGVPGLPQQRSASPAQIAEMQGYQVQAAFLKQAIDGVNVSLSIVGGDRDTKWKVFGDLKLEHLLASDIDKERLIIVGKVKRILAEGESRTVVTVAGFEQMANSFGMQSKPKPRADSEGEGEKIREAKESAIVRGPALELDILAICR